MGKLKSFFLIFIAVISMFFITACGSSGDDNDNNNDDNNNTNEPIEYTVSFDLNDDDATGQPANQTIESGDTASEPTDPTLEGYIFMGWYTENSCTNEFSFSDEITEDITLYAKWEVDESNQSGIPDGLTYSEAVERITAYIDQMSELNTSGIEAYDEKNDDWLGLGPMNVNLSFVMPLITVALTAPFGTDGADLTFFESSYALFGYENISYVENNNQYILEFDNEDYSDGITYHYGLVVDYDASTDSGRIIEYKSYGTEDEVIEMSFEFVKTNDGYAIQNSYGQCVFVLNNKQVVSYTMSAYKDEEVRTSIFANPNMIDNDFALEGMADIMQYDGSSYTYIETEYDTDLITGITSQYRINTYEFAVDGTLIEATEGEWIPMP